MGKLGDIYNSSKEYIKEVAGADDPSGASLSAVDITDGLRNNKDYTLMFQHVPSGKKLYFKGFLTGYSEQFISNWTSDTVYGRMDDIYTFQNTKRQIKVGFVIPAFDYADAKDNLTNVSELTRMLYPAYTTQSSNKAINTLSAAPLIRLKFVNLIQKSTGTALLGKMNGLSYTPNLDDGFFDKPMELLPKTIDIDFTFDVLHEHVLGWSPGAWKGTSVFPYMPSPEVSVAAAGAALAAVDTSDKDALQSAIDGVADAQASAQASALNRGSPEDARADALAVIAGAS